MLKKFFNWAAEKPFCQYTLGGKEHSFEFNRAARFVERVVTLPPLAVGALIVGLGIPAALVAGAPAILLGTFVAGGLVAAFGKAHGLVYGALTHLAAAGLSGLANRYAASKVTPPAP